MSLADGPHARGRRRSGRAALVDALLCAAAGVPVLGVLVGVAELFLFGTIALPVLVMLACSLDPWSDDEIARLGGSHARETGLEPPPRDPGP